MGRLGPYTLSAGIRISLPDRVPRPTILFCFSQRHISAIASSSFGRGVNGLGHRVVGNAVEIFITQPPEHQGFAFSSPGQTGHDFAACFIPFDKFFAGFVKFALVDQFEKSALV
jgi:hypothetical protein